MKPEKNGSSGEIMPSSLSLGKGGGVKDTTVPAAMWTRKVVENRVFRNNHYLYPFLQRELDRNKVLTQNYGW